VTTDGGLIHNNKPTYTQNNYEYPCASSCATSATLLWASCSRFLQVYPLLPRSKGPIAISFFRPKSSSVAAHLSAQDPTNGIKTKTGPQIYVKEKNNGLRKARQRLLERDASRSRSRVRPAFLVRSDSARRRQKNWLSKLAQGQVAWRVILRLGDILTTYISDKLDG
jgi:hypothetical protein